MRIFLLIGCMLIFSIGVVFADTKIELEGRYWITDLACKGKVTELSVIGSDINFKDDLGITDKDFPELRLTWNTGPRSKIRFAYTEIDYSNDKNITKTVTFAGRSYTLGTKVSTTLDVKYLRLGWFWQFIDIAEGAFKLGTLLELKGFMVDASLAAPTLSFSESEQFMGGLPTLGVALDINPLKKINLFAEISGLHAGDYGYFFDAEVGMKIIPLKNFSITGGYRIFNMELEDDNSDYAKLSLTGPFMTGTLRF